MKRKDVPEEFTYKPFFRAVRKLVDDAKNNSSILFTTNEDYLRLSLNRRDVNSSMANAEILGGLYEAIEKKDINLVCVFIGNTTKMSAKTKRECDKLKMKLRDAYDIIKDTRDMGVLTPLMRYKESSREYQAKVNAQNATGFAYSR